MLNRMILVRAQRDELAGVWVATSEDVPGLVTEAATLEDLQDKVLIMIPELLEANQIDCDLNEIPVHIVSELTTRITNPRIVSATP